MGQMFLHELNPAKGWPSPYALDKTVELDIAYDAVDTVFAGMVAHKSPAASGRLRCGLPATDKVAGTAPMPIFLFQNATDFDVQVDSGTVLAVPNVFNTNGRASKDTGITAAPAGGFMHPLIGGLVATGGYELETTEYVGNPTTGVLLTSPTKAVSASDKGKLTAASNGTTIPAGTIVCAVVSDGAFDSDQYGGPKRLRFWPVYLPIFTTPT